MCGVLLIRYPGTSVSFLGVAPHELSGNKSSGSYTIDTSAPTKFIIPGHEQQTEYNQLLFTTQDIEPGFHTLVVTYEGGSDQAPLVLDHLYLANRTQTSTSPPQSSSTLAASALVTLTSSAPAGSKTADSTSISLSPTKTPRPSAGSMSIAAVVGGTLGGVVASIGLGLLLWRLKRRSRKRGSMNAVDSGGTEEHRSPRMDGVSLMSETSMSTTDWTSYQILASHSQPVQPTLSSTVTEPM